MRFWLGILLSAAAFSADPPFYVGTWKIESAAVAPWWTDSKRPDDAETKGLVGKIVKIMPKSIEGPRQVACAGPRYQVKDYPADMLFQGSFGEMHLRDKTANPSKVAAAAGFVGTKWKTLETGCGNEVDYHFIDASTAAFGLNNYIYRLRKQP
jgi:hypothetical protein